MRSPVCFVTMPHLLATDWRSLSIVGVRAFCRVVGGSRAPKAFISSEILERREKRPVVPTS